MVIELPDQQVEALKAKAAAQGLTLEVWLQRLAEEDHAIAVGSPQEAAARILELQKRVKPDPEGWTIRDYINHDRGSWSLIPRLPRRGVLRTSVPNTRMPSWE